MWLSCGCRVCHCGTGPGQTPLDLEQWRQGEVSREGTEPALPEPEPLSDYELERLANVRRNADVLESLGLARPTELMGTTSSDKTSKKRKRPKKKVRCLALAFHRLCFGLPPPLLDLPLPWVIDRLKAVLPRGHGSGHSRRTARPGGSSGAGSKPGRG